MIVVIVYGGIEIINMVGALVGLVEGEKVSIMPVLGEHLQKLSWIGADLSILFLGYKAGKEYFEDSDVKIYHG